MDERLPHHRRHHSNQPDAPHPRCRSPTPDGFPRQHHRSRGQKNTTNWACREFKRQASQGIPPTPMDCNLCKGPLKVSNAHDPDFLPLSGWNGTGEEMAHLPCGHFFGIECLERWRAAREFGDRSVCPTCRVEFPHYCGHPVRPMTTADRAWDEIPRTVAEGGLVGKFCVECETRNLKISKETVFRDVAQICGVDVQKIRDAAAEYSYMGPRGKVLPRSGETKWAALFSKDDIWGNDEKMSALRRAQGYTLTVAQSLARRVYERW
ncbi:putative RING finger protein-like protein [Zalerion maritima]|uniref:RING finger protein-like protein n=1 Tax=Zalerion maritima TaxID=339359 RepID=A0AAD5RZF2_9PEZI|nr:putative RING finger protein-like protein [Zalerion maritima]